MDNVNLSHLRIGALALTLAVGSSAVAGAAADKTPHDRSLVLSKLDTTGNDGTLTLKEVDAAALVKFAQLDTDRDGTLDASELTGILTPAELAAADPDKDGDLNKSEYLAVVKKQFLAADRDNDGTLDQSELSTQRGVDLVALLAY